ncbi:MAG: Unknown protein [uncultured Sulfurovum sp.]|uniref:Uncharacterized protein n=1 Tax=uncultured Sulfurovum sp. TaxID=269237 RepID=A0A6S6SXV2_9BACT|nr:MAG: Unknown protein [uncultured Sulfurovum sp.]
MFGVKANDTLITSIVSVLGIGIIYLVTTTYQSDISIKNLQNEQKKLIGKVNLLIAHIQTDTNTSTSSPKLNKYEILKLLSAIDTVELSQQKEHFTGYASSNLDNEKMKKIAEERIAASPKKYIVQIKKTSKLEYMKKPKKIPNKIKFILTLNEFSMEYTVLDFLPNGTTFIKIDGVMFVGPKDLDIKM